MILGANVAIKIKWFSRNVQWNEQKCSIKRTEMFNRRNKSRKLSLNSLPIGKEYFSSWQKNREELDVTSLSHGCHSGAMLWILFRECNQERNIYVAYKTATLQATAADEPEELTIHLEADQQTLSEVKVTGVRRHNTQMAMIAQANDRSNYLRHSVDNQYNHNVRLGAMRNSYSGRNALGAGYVATTLPFGKLSLYAGVRFEYNQMELITNTRDDVESHQSKFYRYKDFFPSINSTYAFNEQNQLRLSYGKSVNRQEFREVAPSVYYDFDLASHVQGNVDLKPCYVHNLDLRYEFYPTRGEQITLAGFYKRFENPIEWTYTVAAGWPIGLIIDGEKGDTPAQAKAGTIRFHNNVLAGMDIVGSPFMPTEGSPLLNKASFEGKNSAWFDKVSFVGAFNASDNWLSGWTNFDPQNTTY